MKYDSQDFTLVLKKEIGDGIFDFVLQSSKPVYKAQPGQFAHVRVEGKTLRRPISICSAGEDWIRLVFQVKGEGTKIMSEAKVNDKFNIISPLGHGFELDSKKRYAFIGGGIGVPPMLYCAEQTENPLVITGFRNKRFVILQEDFKSIGAELILTTDDGSLGRKGFVTDVLKEKICDIDEVCACGPMPMLKSVSDICKETGIQCQISLEERMGCGVGACLVCACKTVHNGEEEYSHVCKNGPVFNSKEVFF